MSQQKNSTNYVIRICKICNNEYSGHFASSICSEECKQINENNKQELKRNKQIKDSHIKYPDDSDPYYYAECKICGYRSKDLATHILYIHNTPIDNYKQQYGVAVKSQDICDSVKGDKNPAYQHGGKYSPFSKKFIKYEEVDGVEDIINDLKIKATQTKSDNNNNNTTVEYYTSRGMTLEEAQEALRSRQTTFTLDICIEKYGHEEGYKVWKDRQERWQNSLNSKTQEEIDDINKRKSTKMNFNSLWSLNLDEDGWIYLIKIDDHKLKIGITSKPNINKRYKQSVLDAVEVMLFEKAKDITHAFMIEQYIKRNNLDKILKGDYGAFGWTDFLHNTDPENIMKEVVDLLQNKELTHDKFINEII
jgi:hypothetical protein